MLAKITIGTPFGDMTAYSGVVAAFNGAHLKPAASCAGKNATTSAYVGLSFSTPKAVACVQISGSNDDSYNGLNSDPKSVVYPITFNLRASNTLPANSSAGSLLGSITFDNYTSLGERIRRIFSSDIVSTWNYVWVEETCGTSGTMLMGEMFVYSPYASETVSAGPAGAISTLRGLRAESHGSGTPSMYASCNEATLVNPLDGTTQVLRSPLNYRQVSFSGFSSGQTVWAWLLWGSGTGFLVVADPAIPPSQPVFPTGYTHARELFPLVIDPTGNIHSKDHPVIVKEDRFYYSSGDYVSLIESSPPFTGDHLIDLSSYVPAGAGHASIFLDPEMVVTGSPGGGGLILRNRMGGNYAVIMLYAQPSAAAASQMTVEMPISDDRLWAFQWLDVTFSNSVTFGFIPMGYKF